MTNILSLIYTLAEQEQNLTQQPFMAPCILNGSIRVKLSELICTLKPVPSNYEGWGVFEALNTKQAKYLKRATRLEVDRYLLRLSGIRLRLATPLRGQTWLAYPIQEADMHQQLGAVRPIPVYLVKDGAKFEPIVARWDGRSLWWQKRDRTSKSAHTRQLRQALRQEILPEKLKFPGLTPEMKTTYKLASRSMPNFAPKYRDERRLSAALKQGGGVLEGFTDRGNFWTVQWITRDGQHHSSAIAKNDLTVIGAGICLDGYDRDFDLQSLVGVVEQQWD